MTDKNKISLVKNPLTVIAVFAGIAETSGTAILPFLEPSNQSVYIWFLMLFPIVLVVLFFWTLNNNHKVLYAPSDFIDENNFIDIIKTPSIKDTISKLKKDFDSNQIELQKERITDEKDLEKPSRDNYDLYNLELNELLVLNEIERKINIDVQRNVFAQIGETRISFDGLAQTKDKLIGIEVKYLRNRDSYTPSWWENIDTRLTQLYQSLSNSQRNSFSLILAIVTNDDINKVKEFISNELPVLVFPLEIQVFSYQELEKKRENIYNHVNTN